MIEISKQQDEFKGFKILDLCRDEKGVKPVFEFIYKEGAIFSASDSRRLVVFTCENFAGEKDGFYKVVSSKSSEIDLNFHSADEFSFPDFSKIMPDPEKVDPENIFTGSGNAGKNKLINGQNTGKLLYELAQRGVCINPMYLDVLTYADDPFNVYVQGPLSPVLMELVENLRYILMPVQVKNR